jgi:hypothetical protein
MMDNFDGKDPQARRNAIEKDISRLSMEIGVVDRKVRYYLADRSKNPHPRHLDLIEKIQRYRIDPTVSNRHLETLLENLQWKIFYYQQSWRQMWENAENARGRRQASEPASGAGASGRPDVDKAFEEAQSAAERKDPPGGLPSIPWITSGPYSRKKSHHTAPRLMRPDRLLMRASRGNTSN